jgi:hypothetical protein
MTVDLPQDIGPGATTSFSGVVLTGSPAPDYPASDVLDHYDAEVRLSVTIGTVDAPGEVVEVEATASRTGKQVLICIPRFTATAPRHLDSYTWTVGDETIPQRFRPRTDVTTTVAGLDQKRGAHHLAFLRLTPTGGIHLFSYESTDKGDSFGPDFSTCIAHNIPEA